MPDTFTVKTDAFEGPLELLLDLIEKRKLFVNDVALAQVTDDYMGYVARLTSFPMADVANFVVIASTLLLIKSKSLLPELSLTREEETDMRSLELRLKMYQYYRDLARELGIRFGTQMLFLRGFIPPQEPVFVPHESITVGALGDALRAVLDAIPQPKKMTETVVQKVVSIEEMIGNLTERIQKSITMRFSEFAGSAKERGHVIVGFLALLELVKQGLVTVRQHGAFKDIEMEHSAPSSLPHYG